MHLNRREFEAIIKEAIKEMPGILRDKMENIEIIIEQWPSQEVLKEMGISSRDDLLGLYRGTPKPHRGIHYQFAVPDTITLYQRSIEYKSRSLKEIKDNIQQVVYHEIGHYYGFNDEELERLEEE